MSDQSPGLLQKLRDIFHAGNNTPAKTAVRPEILQHLSHLSRLPPDDVLASLGTRIDGLSENEAEEYLELYGPNQIVEEELPAGYIQFLEAFVNPFIGVLLVLAVVSFLTDVVFSTPGERDWTAVVIIGVMVLISVTIRFWQEYHSSREAAQLKAMVTTTGTVYRPEIGRQEIPISRLVPGDIIHLSAGDMIPGDVRVLSSKDLFVSQSALTGESLPVEKYEIPHQADMSTDSAEKTQSQNSLDIPNLCFMGTSVVSGTATALILATGSRTYFGTMAKTLVGRRAETSFDKGINSVSWLIIRFIAVMVPVIFFINGFTKGDWLQAFLFSLSVAVGLTPEMLPMIVTANLAKGAATMAKNKTIVKRLNAIQNFGAMDVLCTDKTGTLTQDKIILLRYMGIRGREDIRVLQHAYLNSYYQTGLKNLLDVAVLEHEDIRQIGPVEKEHVKIDEIPFDFQRKRMSVVLRQPDGRNILITKGAIEEILARCTEVDDHGVTIPLTDEHRNTIQAVSADLNDEGLRVLGVAVRVLPAEERTYTVSDESGLVFFGYIGFLDPPKETAGPAIAALKNHGISVKVLTGDNPRVTRKICEHVGINTEPVVLGSELDAMSDRDLENIVEETAIFARMSPLQKARVIHSLQKKGHTVGYLGDGINDAAALREADVGISVDTAADIAKESADIILLEKSLMILEQGVIQGRRTFGNIMKYIKMAASSNFGNMFSVVIASAFLPFLPMLAIQILVQNLCYDISQISIPWDHVDDDYLKVPRIWNPADISRFMIYIGPISSIFDITTFAIMWYVFGATTPGQQSLFQSGWFIEGLLTQTLIVHMIRTRHIPFFQSVASWPVLVLTGIIMAIGITIPFTEFGNAIGLTPLPLAYFPWLIGTLLCYCILTQLVKMWYIRRYGTWL